MNGDPIDTGDGTGARGEVERIELDKHQAAFVRKMAESKATAPHLYLTAEAEMSRALEAAGESGATAVDLILRATALALKAVPRLNGAYRDGAVELYSRINPCFAVQIDGAVVFPTVFDADTKSLHAIGQETRDLTEQAMDGSITAPDLSGSTFTVHHVEGTGADAFTPIINPPQAATLGAGSIESRPVALDDRSLEARPTLPLNLSCDGRIVGTTEGVEFLSVVRRLIEDPATL